MPELPEVETVVRGLSEILKDQPRIELVKFNRADLRDPMPKKKIQKIFGQPVTRVLRRSKYILFETPVGWLISHLGMTGSWRVGTKNDKRSHDHVEILFKNGVRLIYRDPRRFGILDWADAGKLETHVRFKDLGVEPLTEDFSGKSFREIAGDRSAPIKNVLMDASSVVGVGNIYASESLFRAGIKPTKMAKRLKQSEWDALVLHVKDVLKEAIRAGGSSINDYISAQGERGDFQSRFKVYDRAGEPCRTCGTMIKKVTLAGRSSYFCPKCQS